MKKIFRLLPLLLIALVGVSLSACGDDKDDDKVIESNILPAPAKTFLETYYPGVSIAKVSKDNDNYDVLLANGHDADFDLAGEWLDVEAPVGQSIPSGFYPAAIDNYIATNAGAAAINEISKETYGYEVTLTTGAEYDFNPQGEFLRYGD